MAVGRNMPTTIQTYGKISYFIKSVIYWEKSNLVWWLLGPLALFKKNSVAIATCLEEFDFLAPISQRVYSHMKVDTIITILLSIATWHEFRSEKHVSYLIEASATQITHVKLTSPISVCSALFHSVELACPRSYVLFLIHSWHFTLTGVVFLLAAIMVCRDSQKEPQTVFQLNYMYITVSVGWVVLIT